jgi:hypothetical protein
MTIDILQIVKEIGTHCMVTRQTFILMPRKMPYRGESKL